MTDGLPVVPPTRERVARAIEASGRAADELIALVPPNFGRATVEKVASLNQNRIAGPAVSRIHQTRALKDSNERVEIPMNITDRDDALACSLRS